MDLALKDKGLKLGMFCLLTLFLPNVASAEVEFKAIKLKDVLFISYQIY
jgi:hypothetical protein